jgi:hypothetical protein
MPVETAVPDPTGQATGAQIHESPAPTPIHTEEPFPNAAERALMARLPAALGTECRRDRSLMFASQKHPGLQIFYHAATPRDGLKCDLPLGQRARTLWLREFSGQQTLASQRVALTYVWGSVTGTCGDSAAGSGPWSIAGRQVGTVICKGGATEAAWIAWTYDEDGVFATAVNDSGDWQGLYRWWQAIARYMRR